MKKIAQLFCAALIAGMVPACSSTVAKMKPVKNDVDPNQTVHFVYRPNYDHAWSESLALLTHMGFRLDRTDYRLGVITTLPMPSSQIVEPYKRDLTGIKQALENTVNTQQRSVRLTLTPVEGKPEFYAVGVQVLVERLANPRESLGGTAFVEGSGFGRSDIALQSDYAADPKKEDSSYYPVGHDVALENKILSALLNKI